jgi:uncharacterized protein YndB with AHSA1/START domain
MAAKNAEAELADRELVATRTFNAPPSLVFKLWIDPNHVGKWWGPRGFTTTTHEMDVRPGGHWKFTMHGPDGKAYPNDIEYIEIDPPNLLVYDHFHPDFRSTVTFEEKAGKTCVTVWMLFATAEERALVVKQNKADVGLRQHLESLEAHLEQTKSENLVIVRTFDAPPERLWAMWTQPEHFAKWWGPRSFTTPFVTIDVRVGGTMLVCMRPTSGDFPEHWFKGTFEEIVEFERLVIRQQFCDPQGTPIDPRTLGFPPEMPGEMMLTVTFTNDEGRTRMRLEHTIPRVMAEGGARLGWTESFDRLDETLVDD